MFLEVIASNIEDVILINQSKANRIEFCSNLECGGLTPNLELIKQAAEISNLPINVIIRENESWDFIFTKEEKQKMINDITWISKNTKVNGIVIGSLISNEQIDFDFINQVNLVKGNLETTFHKAFDQIKNKNENLKKLEKLNITNVLTSGGNKLEDNWDTLDSLKKLNSKTKLLIGGGVNEKNLEKCLKYSDNIHIGTSAREDGTWNSKVSISKINNFKK